MLNCFIKVMNPIFKEAINLYKKGELKKAQKICLEVINSKPLFNIKLYTKHVESAYKTIYERYNGNLPIDDNIEIS